MGRESEDPLSKRASCTTSRPRYMVARAVLTSPCVSAFSPAEAKCCRHFSSCRCQSLSVAAVAIADACCCCCCLLLFVACCFLLLLLLQQVSVAVLTPEVMALTKYLSQNSFGLSHWCRNMSLPLPMLAMLRAQQNLPARCDRAYVCPTL